MKSFILPVILFALAIRADGQRLYAAVGFSADGQPVQSAQNWEIQPGIDGSAIFFVFRNEGNRDAQPNSLFLRHRPLRQPSSGTMQDFVAYDEVYRWVAGSDDFRVYDYTFKEEGAFEATVRNEEGRAIASTTIVVQRSGSSPSAATALSDSPSELVSPQSEAQPNYAAPTVYSTAQSAGWRPSSEAFRPVETAQTWRPGRARMLVCKGVQPNGDAVGAADRFSIKNGEPLFALVQAERSFGDGRVRFELYKIDPFGDESLIDGASFDARPEWNWFRAPYRFGEPGRYKFKFYVDSRSSEALAESLVLVQTR